jgi:hypothetical protein
MRHINFFVPIFGSISILWCMAVRFSFPQINFVAHSDRAAQADFRRRITRVLFFLPHFNFVVQKAIYSHLPFPIPYSTSVSVSRSASASVSSSASASVAPAFPIPSSGGGNFIISGAADAIRHDLDGAAAWAQGTREAAQSNDGAQTGNELRKRRSKRRAAGERRGGTFQRVLLG